MGSRSELQLKLQEIIPNVYFQPPSSIKLIYPCIIFVRSKNSVTRANNDIYGYIRGYDLTVIDKNPDAEIAEKLERHFQYCSITNAFVSDRLNHTTLKLYY